MYFTCPFPVLLLRVYNDEVKFLEHKFIAFGKMPLTVLRTKSVIVIKC